MAIIDKIQISGTNYDIKDASATTVVNVTQAEYDDLVTGGTLDPSVLYNITDATLVDISQYWTSAQTQSAITEATSGKVDIASIVTAVTTASTDSEIPSAKAVNDAIEAGGGSITIDPTLDSGSTNPVANSAITNAIDTKANKTAALGSINFGSFSSKPYIRFDKVSGLQGSQYYICQINGKDVWGFTNSLAWKNWELVETSAITTSITSSSTDTQVPSAKAVYDQIGGMKIVKLTESEYTALVTKDADTLYVVIPDPSN